MPLVRKLYKLGKRDINIERIEPVGTYALRLLFSLMA